MLYKAYTFIVLVGLLSRSAWVAAVPVERKPGNVVTVNPGHFVTANGEDDHALNYNGKGMAALGHPAIIKGPAVVHNGQEFYPIIPMSSSGHPPGEGTERHLASLYNKHGAGEFKPGSELALGEGVYVHSKHILPPDSKLPGSLFPGDWKELSNAEAKASAAHTGSTGLQHQAGSSNLGPPPRNSPPRGRSGSRAPSSTRRRDRSRSRSPSRGGSRSTRQRTPSNDRYGGSSHRSSRQGQGRSPTGSNRFHPYRSTGGRRGSPVHRQAHHSVAPRRGNRH
ncbi:hypothetical protein GALMADRAFT_232278 [Galerina marginata CBS 339.88]|uniref:Uncharacterized protein n=1 Tax=Galerina marginata (strain CBS 339.88) TaxID=685588 RepID=A0A067SGK4_GALM3|nr:hypothetical protein GALMADRAFT_232278 [Galerina marginata CBS 339.88]